MTDISGFTNLTETYSLKGKGGTDQLTKTLANYMGPLAECILRSNGDIIKFAGDAFLSVWEVRDEDEYPQVLQKVIDCALYCQEKYGSYATDVQITIRVKVGIGCGVCYAAGLGSGTYHHYAVYGPGVAAASDAEHHCVSGDVIINPVAWNYCDPKNFSIIPKEDGYMKVTDILHFIDPTKRGRPIVAHRLAATLKQASGEKQSGPSHEIMRPILETSLTTSCEHRLRKYVIPPVLKKLDEDIPIEYLNESRMVSICFMHIDYKPLDVQSTTYGEQLAEIVQTAFVKILRSATNLNGCLTKVIMFDKGLTYLVVFGLPGYIQDNQTANALKFALEMEEELPAEKSIREVSIGVTTGATYCGVIGHPRRHEYTVIGKKVNKAARLMCYYPGKVTCDQDTYYNSKLPSYYFQLQEAKNLKGISNVGNIYEYVGSDGEETHISRRYEFPMLGRKTELESVRTCLRLAADEFDRFLTAHAALGNFDKHSAIEYTSSGAWMLVIEGENGIGKSRFLASCVREAELLGWKVFTVAMTLQHAASSLYAVTDLLTQAFHMDGIRSSAEREEHLRKLVADSNDPELISGICNLNELLHLKLPIPAKFAYADSKSRHTFAQHMSIQMLKHYYPEDLILFCVEDAHYMPQTSWEYLQHISRMPNLVTLMTLRRNNDGLPKIPDVAYKICYHSQHVKTIQLEGLESPYLLPLACQILEVRGIPVDVEKLLVEKSHGNPYWVEDVLSDLVASQKLKIVDHAKEDKLPREVKISFVNPRYIKREELDIDGNSFFDTGGIGSFEHLHVKSLRVRNNPDNRLCLVKSNTTINAKRISGGLKEMVLDTFDSFNTNDQMIMKCASVLGSPFSRAMLNRLLPTSGRDFLKYLTGFQRLMDSHVFRCATAVKSRRGSDDSSNAKTPINCACNAGGGVFDFLTGDFQEDLSQLQLPQYAYCRYSEFVKDNMPDVVYEILTEDQKKELHLRAAQYLETSAIQCMNCGGYDTIYVYGFPLQSNDMAAENEEQAVAMGGKWRRQSRPLQVSAKREVSMKTLRSSYRIKQQLSESKTDTAGDKRRKPNAQSIATRIHGLRRSFESGGGGQLAAMELDILRSLLESESSVQCFQGCTGKSVFTDIDDNNGPRASMASISSQNKNRCKMVENFSKEDARKSLSVASASGAGDSLYGSRDEEDEDLEGYDFRGCECTTIQARVSADLIRHYRKAEKMGKCMLHLLEAAESMLAVGSTQQAFQYVDEAETTMELIFEGKLPAPNADDPNDVVIIDREFNRQRFFIRALVYFETGAFDRAKDLFMHTLELMGIKLPASSNDKTMYCKLMRAKCSLWRYHHAPPCCRINRSILKTGDVQAKTFPLKIRSLSYMQKLYKSENLLELGLLASMWHVLLVEGTGSMMHDKIPAYCGIIEMWSAVGDNKKAKYYEKESLSIIRLNLGTEEQVDPLGLLTSANLFQTLAHARLQRGEIERSVDAGYLVLRISNILHDNGLACHVFPPLISGLMLMMKIQELGEAFPGLWFASQADDNWPGTATYFCLVMEMILDIGVTMDSFYHCEQFVTGKDWNDDIELFREFDMRFNFESGLALWYCRYSKWDECSKWMSLAEEHQPAVTTVLGVKGRLRLMQVYLIRANYHQMKKRYQLFAHDISKYKSLRRLLKKEVKAVPLFVARLNHLIGYYCRIRGRKRTCEKYLHRAMKVAKRQGNQLEQEFVKHSRIVWVAMANPDIKYYWLEHAESDSVDWHAKTDLPWANIMYSLPVPAWT